MKRRKKIRWTPINKSRDPVEYEKILEHLRKILAMNEPRDPADWWKK